MQTHTHTKTLTSLILVRLWPHCSLIPPKLQSS